MRPKLAMLVAGAFLSVVSAARAETKVFIIANNADGYGIDRCLADGEQCGVPIAAAYCRSQAFSKVASFHKVDRDELTGAVPTKGSACGRGACEEFVAIACSR